MKLRTKQTQTPISEKMRKLNLTMLPNEVLSPNAFEVQVVESLDGDLLELLEDFD
jgi:hypothetical protein